MLGLFAQRQFKCNIGQGEPALLLVDITGQEIIERRRRAGQGGEAAFLVRFLGAFQKIQAA